MTPLVSIGIPTYNGANHLAECLESVFAQTFEDFEVTIIDDRSSDATLSVAAQFDDPRLLVQVNEKRLGPEDNWNEALKAGSSPFVKVLAQDDTILPRCLELQVAALEADDSVAFVAARRDITDEQGRTLVSGRGLAGLVGRFERPTATRRLVRSGTNIFGEGAAVLMRRAEALEVGGFKGIRPYVIDLDLWVRLLARGAFIGLDEILATFRVTGGQWSVALARRQATEVRSLFRDMRSDPGNGIRSVDAILGWWRAGIMAWLRRFVYLMLRLRRVF